MAKLARTHLGTLCLERKLNAWVAIRRAGTIRNVVAEQLERFIAALTPSSPARPCSVLGPYR